MVNVDFWCAKRKIESKMAEHKIQLQKVMALSFLVLLLSPGSSYGLSIQKRGLADDVKAGISLAGKIFGFDAASNVADLVSRAFANNNVAQSKPAHYESNADKGSGDSDASQSQTAINDEVETNVIGTGNDPGNLVGTVLRVLGMDNSKIGALAVNGLIFIAQMIGRVVMSTFNRAPSTQNVPSGAADESTFEESSSQRNTDKSRARSLTFDNSFDWILEKQATNSIFSKQLDDAKDKNLPQRIVRSIDDDRNDPNTACIKLLLCKSAPIIRGMQRAVLDNNDSKEEVDEKVDGGNRLDVFFKHLPDVEEFKKHGYECGIRYSDCKIFTT